MDFKTLDELEKWLKKNQGNLIKDGYVTGKNGNKIKENFAGSMAMDNLISQAKKLEYYLNDEIEIYYNTYDPIEYNRTYSFLNSVRVSDPAIEADGTVTIEIYFDPDLATHPSVISRDYEDGFVPILLNQGWQWGGTKGELGPYRFARYSAKNEQREFLDNAIKRYIASEKPDSKFIEVWKKLVYHGVEDKGETRKMN